MSSTVEGSSVLLVPPSRRRFEAVVDGILELVEARGMRPGQALPPERELAETFGVSRNVLRQAFGILEERGLLHTVRGSGRYLRSATGEEPDQQLGARATVEMASIADLLEARTLIEVQVAALACDRRTAEQSRTLAVLAGRLTSWDDNLTFHCAIAAATQNFALERLVRQQTELAGQLHQREHYNDPDELARMRAEHQEIAAAITARDGERAQQLVRGHLHRTRGLVFSTAH